MVYGKYKDARNASWRCLLDYGISALPVNLSAIAVPAGIRVHKNSSCGILAEDEIGSSFLTGGDWHVYYDDMCNVGRQRFTIAHEFGHILMGHTLIECKHGRTFDTDKPEGEISADVFASRLLAPACVLWGLGLHRAEDIQRACNISLEAAQYRARRMEELYRRERFLTHPLERKVYEQFFPFIEKNKQ